MFSLNGCTVVLPDGSKLMRQRVSLDENLQFVSADKRTGTVKFESAVTTYTQLSKTKYKLIGDLGEISVFKSGCNCGR
jgi:hypothetical protein